MVKYNIDFTLLKVLQKKDNLEKFFNLVPTSAADTTKTVIKDYKLYFQDNPKIDQIDLDSFKTFIKVKHEKSDPEKISKYLDAIDIVNNIQEDLEDGLHDTLLTIKSLNDITDVLKKVENNKEETNVVLKVRGILDQYEEQILRKPASSKLNLSLSEILAQRKEERKKGLRWSLTALNEAMRELLPGDFGIIAARPDAGKSSFIASQLVHFAKQISNSEKILWLNNEGDTTRLKSRLSQAALKCTENEMLEMFSDENTDLDQMVKDILKEESDAEKIEYHNITNWSNIEIEELIKQKKPKLIIFDMLDNVSCESATINGGNRTDQILETLYQWGRSLSIKYQCIVIATSQTSQDAEGLEFPLQHMLNNSKTSKQGTAEFIMMIGKKHNNQLDSGSIEKRYISLTKNKLAKEKGIKRLKMMVDFDLDRCVFDNSLTEKGPNG